MDRLKGGDTYPDLPKNLYETLRTTVRKYPDKTALYETTGNTATYGEMLRRVDAFAHRLQADYQLGKGEVCAILCVNSIDFCVAYYAVLKLGAIALPLSTKFKSNDLLYPLTHSRCRILILDRQWMDQVAPIVDQTSLKTLLTTGEGSLLRRTDPVDARPVDVGPDDPAAILYTSGTTGKPKAACLSHSNLLHAVESYRRILGLSQADRTIIAIPIFNVTGLVALLSLFVYIGGGIWLMARFQAEPMVQTIFENDLTFVHGSPTIFIKMLEQQYKFPHLPSLQKGACGSSNLPVDVLRKLHEWIPDFCMHTVFGMTETSSPAAIMPDDALKINKPGSSGLPIPGVEMKIVDDATGEVLPPGRTGSLLVRGSTVIRSYWGADTDQENREFKDGWLDTGDIGKIDEDGYLYILDRKKDMINRGGEKVYSIEVENILATHPSVAECAVVGCPDPVYGEIVCAFVRLRIGCRPNAEALERFMHGKLATYKLPTVYRFLKGLPKNENGKIRKSELRRACRQPEATKREEAVKVNGD